MKEKPRKGETPFNREQYRASFEAKLGDFSPEGKVSIMHALDVAYDCHPLNQKRDEGVPYVVHVAEAALIAVEFGIKNVNDIIIELIHDGIEESDHIVKRDLPFAKRIEEGRVWLTQEFNSEVADGVIALTKPARKDVKPKTKAKAREEGIEMFKGLPSKDKVRKMPDRVHNLRTLSHVSLRRQKRTLEETREIYLPKFREAVKDHPEYERVLEALNLELNQAQQRYDRDKEIKELKKKRQVASCILQNAEGKILLIHRNTPESRQWETPGGKIEPTEDPIETVKRETKEELGIDIEIERELMRYEIIEGKFIRNYVLYLAQVAGGELAIRENMFDKLGYFSWDELEMMKSKLSVNVRRLVELYKRSELKLG